MPTEELNIFTPENERGELACLAEPKGLFSGRREGVMCPGCDRDKPRVSP